ncbi:MFS transporter [Halorussus marinus]|uniref:MFS transporter n=1 Tax=Halorussus marinus TaxID=2505976 RepID=UPI00106E6E72|nr:MFS transporter [Halorussus marinus]
MSTDATATAESSIPWRSSTLYVILSSSLIGVMGVSLLSPVLPSLRSVFAISDSQVGLVITAYTLPGIFLTPFMGLVADRLGRRQVIIPLLFLFGAAGAGISLSSNFAEVLALRFLQGIGASALVTLAVTLIGDFYEGGRRNAIMGLNGSMVGAGAAVYPLIGGALAGIRWNVPFLFFGTAILVGLAAVFVLDEPEQGEPTGVPEYLRRMRDVIVLPEALAIFAVILVVFFVFYGAVLTALPLLLSDEFGLGSGQIGPILAMVSLASATVSSQYGRVSQWRTAPELLALGFVAYGTSLLGVWLAPSPIFVGAALLAFGVGFGVVMPSIDTTVVTLVSGDLRAGMMGMRTSMLRLGQTLGPIAFTFVADTAFASSLTGYRTLLLVAGCVVAAAGSVGYALLRR